MGRFILCTSKKASKPYVFPVSGAKVYTIEQMCYYIYNNIYEMSEECFDTELVKWLREEIRMDVIADKLQTMIEIKSSLKDRVISIMCCCDYYTENDIKALLTIVAEIEKLSLQGKIKLKADYLLKYGRYPAARKVYDKLISGAYAVNLSPKEYGNVLHNRSMACFFMGSHTEAIEGFREAYARNNDIRSLKHYFMALLLSGNKELFQKEIEKYGIEDNEREELILTVSDAYENAVQSKEYMELVKRIRHSEKKAAHDYAGKRLDIYKEQLRQGGA